MSLQYLSGLSGPKRVAKKAAKVEKKAVKKTARVEKKAVQRTVKMSPVTKSRVNKLQIQSKIRKTFSKKAEPVAVEPEEILEEQEKPADFQPAEAEAEEQETQAEAAEETTDENAELGIFYPGMVGKIKIKAPKLKGKLKTAVKKTIQRQKDDKHKPVEKAAHLLAKNAFLLPRGAFLTVMLLGKELEKTPIKINLGKKISKAYATKKKQIDDFWYKVGGEPDILEKQINKFKQSKVSGVYLGEPVTIAASAATSAPLIAKFLKIVGEAGKFAENNKALLAVGQAAAKKGLDAAVKKNPELANSVNLVADQLTKVLPPEQQAKIDKIRKNLPKTTVDKVVNQTTKEVVKNTTAANTNTTAPGVEPKSNKMLLIGGGAALIGAYFLLKKKK